MLLLLLSEIETWEGRSGPAYGSLDASRGTLFRKPLSVSEQDKRVLVNKVPDSRVWCSKICLPPWHLTITLFTPTKKMSLPFKINPVLPNWATPPHTHTYTHAQHRQAPKSVCLTSEHNVGWRLKSAWRGARPHLCSGYLLDIHFTKLMRLTDA